MLQTNDNMSKLRFYMFKKKKRSKKEKCLLKQKYHSLPWYATNSRFNTHELHSLVQ